MESKNYEELVKIYAEQEETLIQLDLKLDGADEEYGETLGELENVQKEADEYRLLLDQNKATLIEETESVFYAIKQYDPITNQIKETQNHIKESDETMKEIHTTLSEVMQDQIKSIEKVHETMKPENVPKIKAEYLKRLEEITVALEKTEEELKTIKYEPDSKYEARQYKIFMTNEVPLKREDINIKLKKSQEIMTAREAEYKEIESRLAQYDQETLKLKNWFNV